MENSNSKIESCLKHFYNLLEKLMVPLEYLARYNNSFNPIYFFNAPKYYNLYGRIKEQELIDKIEKAFIEFEKCFKSIITNSNYQREILFREIEIKGYLENICLWKKENFKYEHYFQKLGDIFVQIRNKDEDMKQNKAVFEQIDYNRNVYDNNSEILENQKLQMISKQKIIQAQELTLLNDNLGRALASLECYANRCSENEISHIFDYYDMFDLGKTQDLKELQKKAFLQTTIFKFAYEDYIKKYEKYNFPENIDMFEIIELIGTWMNNIQDESKFMYQGMINIINLSKNTLFEQKFKSYTEQCKNVKMDPKQIASFAPGIYYYNEQRCEEAKNKVLEKGKVISELAINQTSKDDKKAEMLCEQIEINKNNYLEEEKYQDLK